MSMETRHKHDANQCLKMAYDPEASAFRMIPSDQTSFAIEINHEDGDSAYSIPKMKYLKGTGEMDISDCRFIFVTGGNVSVSPHPTDDVWVSVGHGLIEVCAYRVKSEDPGIHIAARS